MQAFASWKNNVGIVVSDEFWRLVGDGDPYEDRVCSQVSYEDVKLSVYDFDIAELAQGNVAGCAVPHQKLVELVTNQWNGSTGVLRTDGSGNGFILRVQQGFVTVYVNYTHDHERKFWRVESWLYGEGVDFVTGDRFFLPLR
jgi:hypothetical protein